MPNPDTADVAVMLRVLSHELRTPVGVIQGYLRLMAAGRVAPDAQPRIYDQLNQATTRIAALGQQASDVAHWLVQAPEGGQVMTIQEMWERAASRVAPTTTAALDLDEPGRETRVRSLEIDALPAAWASVCDAVAREVGGKVTVTGRVAAATHALDLFVQGTDRMTAVERLPGPGDAGASTLTFDRGGLGLAFVLGATIFGAHGGQLWGIAGQPASVGFRLPVEDSL